MLKQILFVHEKTVMPILTLAFFGLDEADLDKTFQVGERIGLGATTLKNIWAHLEKVYAGHVGIEFKYISNQKKVNWLTEEMERNFTNPVPLGKEKKHPGKD